MTDDKISCQIYGRKLTTTCREKRTATDLYANCGRFGIVLRDTPNGKSMYDIPEVLLSGIKVGTVGYVRYGVVGGS